MYDFSNAPDRRGTDSIKWNFQNSFGCQSGLLPFWIADTDFATLPEIMQALENRCAHPILGYAECSPEVIEAVQGWFSRRHGWKPVTEEMFLSAGVVTAIWFTLQALTQPGDGVAVMTPVYDAFFGCIKGAGRTAVHCPLNHGEDGRYTINYENIEQAFKNGAKVLLLCNPHNPIGRVWTREELTKLSDLCKQYGVYVLSDEVHADIVLHGGHYTPMATIPQNADRLVVYTSITKTFNMAGLCSSCLMIPNKEVRGKVQGALYGAWLFGPTAMAFPAIQAAYTHGDAWVDAKIKAVEENAAIVEETIKRDMPEIRVTPLEGTFLMWLDFNCLGLSSDELCRQMACDKYKLALGKGSAYGSEGDGFMRFNIGCTQDTLKEGLARIHKLYLDVKGV